MSRFPATRTPDAFESHNRYTDVTVGAGLDTPDEHRLLDRRPYIDPIRECFFNPQRHSFVHGYFDRLGKSFTQRTEKGRRKINFLKLFSVKIGVIRGVRARKGS